MNRQTIKDRQRLKSELSQKFDRWNLMTDDELMTEAQKRFPILSGTPHRGELIKFLTMDHLDKID